MARDSDTGTLNAGNWAPVREERDDYALPIKGELPRELARHALPQRAEPAVRYARCALVRRRRHAARLHAGERQGELPQPLGAHAEVPGRARRRPRHLVRQGLQRPEAARCAAHDRHRRAASPIPTSSGTRASCWRWRRRTCRPRSIPGRWPRKATWTMPARRPAGDGASQDRSRHRRADLLRLQRHGSVLDRHDCRRHRSFRRGQQPRAVRCALLEHGARLHRHGEPRAVPDPAADGEHGARDEGPARPTPGSPTRAPTSAS